MHDAHEQVVIVPLDSYLYVPAGHAAVPYYLPSGRNPPKYGFCMFVPVWSVSVVNNLPPTLKEVILESAADHFNKQKDKDEWMHFSRAFEKFQQLCLK